MRYLHYTNYESGRSGLSNGIMSVEIGVVLAHLTNRVLVLEGNVSPPANIVAYDGRVDNREPSRVTDLVDIPVSWVDAGDVDLRGQPSLEITNLSLSDLTFYFPKTLDLSSADARAFARGRDQWVTVTGEHDRIPVLRLSEEPLVPGGARHRSNLGLYSYQFYLDDETRRSVYGLLQRMQAKRPFAELAARVARDLGAFNAVHLRRGDFKITYGVTTLDRKPWEAIEAMDQVFERGDRLVIVTDERDDPFFQEIRLAYPDHCFIDWHILDHYADAFAQLPRTDSLALAYLSQLVAAESAEFIGTMTSTFTGMIQRLRGSRGKREAFRYFWNELPEPGQPFERGRHAVSDCIPLDRGTMVEQSDGPYTWNRVSQLLNPGWQREWPESFLTPETLATGALATKPARGSATLPAAGGGVGQQPVARVAFEGLQVAVRSGDAALLQRSIAGLGVRTRAQASNVIANLELARTADGILIVDRATGEFTPCSEAEARAALRRQVATRFALARHHYSWLEAAAFTRGGRGMVLAGDLGADFEPWERVLGRDGWHVVDQALVALRVADGAIVPLGAQSQPEGAAAQAGRVATPFACLALATRAPRHVRTVLAPVSPATAVAALIGASLDFRIERHRAVRNLCRMVEDRPAVQVHWSEPEEAARLLAQWAKAPSGRPG